MQIQFTCLECLGQHVKDKHICPVGSLCARDEHFDFCRHCKGLMMENFEKQFQPVQPETKTAKKDFSNKPRQAGRLRWLP